MKDDKGLKKKSNSRPSFVSCLLSKVTGLRNVIEALDPQASTRRAPAAAESMTGTLTREIDAAFPSAPKEARQALLRRDKSWLDTHRSLGYRGGCHWKGGIELNRTRARVFL